MCFGQTLFEHFYPKLDTKPGTLFFGMHSKDFFKILDNSKAIQVNRVDIVTKNLFLTPNGAFLSEIGPKTSCTLFLKSNVSFFLKFCKMIGQAKVTLMIWICWKNSIWPSNWIFYPKLDGKPSTPFSLSPLLESEDFLKRFYTIIGQP